ncbi:Ger(x)C family spore germination protein [Brevibacillus marinus]|uniref:Ger(x)C family spore germination protein n=1 Tax=Brevibacillus marinus TaxID=2496837 RepID=UPI001F49B828|nr:Ger(x)C family spore germination protein [Brevibacillus marinus]
MEFIMKRKSVVVLFTLSIHALLLSGCWDRTEVNDLAIITAAGLDLTENDQLELSVKMYLTTPSSPQQMGQSGPSGGGAGLSVVRSAVGLTMADAVSKLQQVITRKIFWGQAEVFIFGERLAEAGLVEPMDFLTRHPAPRERANVFVSKGSTAKEVLELNPPIERSVADALREMAKAQTGLNITMKELAQMMAGRAKAAVLPLLEINPKQGDQEAFPFINGTAVLKNGKMIAHMDYNVTRGIMWLRNEIKGGTITISPQSGNGLISLLVLRSHTELVPHIHGDDWSMTVRIEATDDIIENTTDLDLSNPKHIERLQAELEADINRRVKKALNQAQKELNADIFQFADAFYRKYPKEWAQNKDRWDDIFPAVRVSLQTDLRVRKPGLTGKNLFKPEQR